MFSKRNQIQNIFIIIVALLSLYCVQAMQGSSPRVIKYRILDDDSNRTIARPRINEEIVNKPGYYSAELPLEISRKSDKQIFLRSTACIFSFKINGKELDLDKITNADSCIPKQVSLDLNKFLTLGLNLIELEFYQTNKHIRINLEVHTPYAHIYQLVSVIIIILLIIHILNCLATPLPDSIMIIISMAVYLGWAFNFGYAKYTNDIFSHTEYIRYIFYNRTIPMPYEHFVFYHPPGFYLLASFFYALAYPFLAEHSLQWSRAVPFISQFILLIYAAKILRLCIKRDYIICICLAALAASPTAFYTASRLENGCVVNALATVAFFYLVSWYQTKSAIEFTKAFCIAAFSLCFKTNGVIILFIVCCSFIYSLLFRRMQIKDFRRSDFYYSLIILFLSICTNSARNIYNNLNYNAFQPLLVGNSLNFLHALQSYGELAKNDWRQYLLLDFNNYFSTHNKLSHYQSVDNFWICALKSALFDHFSWNKDYAYTLLVLAPVIIFSLVLYLPRLRKDSFFYLSLFYFTVSILALMYLRWSVPSLASTNFRYIFFSLVPLTVLIGLTLEDLANKKHKITLLLAISLVSSFSLISTLMLLAVF